MDFKESAEMSAPAVFLPAERGCYTVAVFCDVFPKICGDVPWTYAFCTLLYAS